ncbi:MAG: LPS export ABC transporter periplasmic protein LptC [Chitinophaga sp.]|nr:LPS export ABC transporter periplasmic protein LptC [Chitinophaga sp.]PJE46674.1 MAG: LPS export ABC transporter periplasmic protein LptC [Sediminibacterium sp.] [Sediminibacterium sp. FEMGT703S]
MINLIFDNKNKFAAFLIGCFFMLACENDVNVVKELGKKKPGIEEGKNITSYLSMGGKMKAKLTAPLLLRYQGDSALKSEFPKTLFVEFYNDSMKLESTLRANYGRYIENENKIYLRDSVVIIRINGDTLETSELFWDQTLGRFHTDKPVTTSQRNPRQKLYAKKGFSSNQTLTDITYYELDLGSFLILPDSTADKKQ